MYIQMGVSKLMKCLLSLFLNILTICAQCAIPQQEEVWCYCCVCSYLHDYFWVKLWHSLVVGCGSPPYRMRMGSWPTTWGFVPVIITCLPYPSSAHCCLTSHRTPPSVCLRKVHLFTLLVSEFRRVSHSVALVI